MYSKQKSGSCTWEAPARRWIRLVDTQADGTHDDHGDDIQPGRLEPLSKGRARIPRLSAIVRRDSGIVAAAEETALLLVGSRASCSRCVGIDRRRCSPIEETHFERVLSLELWDRQEVSIEVDELDRRGSGCGGVREQEQR
jgi:hypothetical protein